MPNLSNRKADVFSIGAGGEFDGFVHGGIAGEIGARYDASIDTCYGLDAGVSSAVFAHAQGVLGTVGVGLELEAKAEAAAALDLELKVSPNMFEEVGVSMLAQAYAEASIAGRLAIVLKAGEIADAIIADAGADGTIGADLARAFVRQVNIEAGTWAKAMVGATAQAFIVARGNLSGDDPGFEIGLGAGAALKVGKGAELYARIGFDDLGEFYDDAADILTEAVIAAVGDTLPTTDRPGVRFVIRFALRTAFVIGRDTLLEDADKKDLVAVHITEIALQDLKAAAGDALNKAGDQVLARLQDLAPEAVRKEIGTLNRAQFDSLMSELRKAVKGLNLRGTGPTAQQIDTTLTTMRKASPEVGAFATHIVTVAWCAAILTDTAPKDTPKTVRKTILGPGAGRGTGPVKPQDAAFWLLEGHGATLFARLFPGLDALLDPFRLALGGKSKQLWAAIWGDDVPADLARVLAPLLLEYAASKLDDVYDKDLRPVLVTRARRDAMFAAQFNATIDPTLSVIPSLMEVILEDALTTGGARPLAGRSTRRALGLIAFRLIAGNIAATSRTMINHMVDNCGAAMTTYARTVKSGRHSHDFAKISEALVPVIGEKLEGQALQHLTGELLNLGGTAFGPTIWSPLRRRTLMNGIDQMVDALSFKNRQDFDQRLDQIENCAFVISARPMKQVGFVLSDIMGAEVKLLANRLPDIIARTGLIALRETIEALLETFADWVRGVQERARQARSRLNAERREVDRLIAQVKSLERQRDQALDRLAETIAARLRTGWSQTRSRVVALAKDKAGAWFDRLPRVMRNRLNRRDRGKAWVRRSVGNLVGRLLPTAPPRDPVSVRAIRARLDELVRTNRFTSSSAKTMVPPGALDSFFTSLGHGAGFKVRLPIPIVNDPTFTVLTSRVQRNNIMLGALNVNLVRQRIGAVQDKLTTLTRLEDSIANRRSQLSDIISQSRLADKLEMDIRAIGALSCKVESPVRMTSKATVNPSRVPVRIKIVGGRIVMAEPGGVQILINGMRMDMRKLRISEKQGVLWVTGRLDHHEGVRRGINMLTVIASSGKKGRRPVQVAHPFLSA